MLVGGLVNLEAWRVSQRCLAFVCFTQWLFNVNSSGMLTLREKLVLPLSLHPYLRNDPTRLLLSNSVCAALSQHRKISVSWGWSAEVSLPS